jgi:adenylate cyclase
VSATGDPANDGGTALGGRKLIAVLYADMVAYSRLIGLDDAGTAQRLRTLRRTLIDPAIREHGGTLVQTGGDSLLVAFGSIDGAVRCALTVQRQLPQHDHAPSPDRIIRFRMGINIGDTIADGTNLHGDAVNVAARLQAECPPGGICVSRAVRDHMHGQLDLAFDALGPLDLRNIARPVEAYVLNLDAAASTPRRGGKPSMRAQREAVTRSPRSATTAIEVDFDVRPAIAVLPFTNFSDSPDQAYFADGIADDIINELASWRTFPVIARNSSFAFKGQVIDVTQLGRELGARYLVDGSCNRVGQRVRVAARLIDAATGIQVAAERFDRSIDELADLQDQIAEMIVGSIAPEVLRAESHRVARRPRKNASSYEHFLRGLEAHYRYTKADNAEAQAHFRRAIEADPRNAQAYALLASAIMHAVQLGWREDDEHNYVVADQLAARAVALDPRAPFAHFSLGSSSMFLGRLDQALAEMRNAIRINPSHAAAHVIMAHLLCYVGQPNEALAAAERALRLSPYDPRMGLWLSAVSQSNYFLEDYEDAAAVGQQALSMIPENLLAQRFAAASLGQLGRVAEADPIVATLRQSTAPSIEAVRRSVVRLYRDQQMIEHMLVGLRKAGLE